jgi:hypothetical protein
MFYLLHGIGGSYRINLDLVACIAWRPGDEAGNVAAEIVFAGGAKMDLQAPQQLWNEFLEAVERKQS